MQAYLIDVINKEHKKVNVKDKPEWKDLAKLCGCKYVEEAHRRIGGRAYTIICDEDGKLKSNKTSALDPDNNLALVGNLLVFKLSANNKLEGLDDSDISIIRNYVADVTFRLENGTDTWPVLLDVSRV